MSQRGNVVGGDSDPGTGLRGRQRLGYIETTAMAYPSTTKCFLDAVDRYACPRAQIRRTSAGWEGIPASEMLRRVAGLAKALVVLGVKPGDRVALLAPNCPEWHVTDFAVQGIGAVDVPLYFNESPDRIVYILNDSGAKIVIAAGEMQTQRLVSCRDRVPALEHVIAVSPPAGFGGEILRYETLIATAGDADIAEYRRTASAVTSDQLATIIYTSGTTGEPKGVMLTHANLTSNALDAAQSHEFRTTDVALSVLPLSHVYERTMDYGYIFHGVPIAYVEQIDTISQALLEVQPTVVAAVPRFFEKMYANILDKGRQNTGVRRKIFDWAMRVAQRSLPWRAYGREVSGSTKLEWRIADKLVYSKIRAGLGGRVRVFASGGAPLSVELAEFFASVNIPIYQGYGLTETSPVVSANVPGANKVGTVGRPIPHVEVKIAEDGEILVRGNCVMQGYYRKPDQTREAFTSDGWLRSGDIGHLDADGYLVVTDRKKELLKTAAGKFVAPQPIENRLKSSPLIANAIVVGDRRKFVSVLLVPNFAALEAKAREDGQTIGSAVAAISDAWVRTVIGDEVERLTADFAQYEKPKRFALIAEDFTAANGELTYTLKLKRRIIEQRYRDVIDDLYADVKEPRTQHLS
ncbi:MAG: long-chain fatty acid--CoA ligase [Candidatus Acidiferrales bacterium]